MSTLSLKHIDKIYPNKVQAVFDFNLEIKDKEFIVFVGPSGCGKSTTLRMVAGLEEISHGELYINGRLMNTVSPKDRNIAMVFQNYALYPHMTVYRNMAFALKLRKVPHDLYLPSPEVDAINIEERNLRKKIRKVNFKFKRKQNDKDLLEQRRGLYAEYYALEEKKEALLKPVMGIDTIGIKQAENEIKKIKKDIAELETRMINIKYYIDKDPEDKDYEAKAKEFGLDIQKQRDQKLLEVSKINEHIEYLKTNVVPLYKIRKSTRVEMDLEINRAADILDLDRYLFRKPSALSGGQRQRVALGRAIVRKPLVFLMDEPLSNLDAKLRVQTRSEISKLHKRVGATTIYVTHDQVEAMTMADRIVIMKDGYIQQIGTPSEVYDDPANRFVGGFIGSPSMNFLSGTVKKDKFVIEKADAKDKEVSLSLNKNQVELLKPYNDKKVILGIRPEKVTLVKEGKNTLQTLNLECDYTELLGYEIVVYSLINGQTVVAKVPQKNPIDSGTKIVLGFNNEDFYFFDAETELRIK